MDDTKQSVLAVLGAGILLGILGDALLRATPWGLNVLLWLTALGGAALVVARRREIRIAPEVRWLVPPALFFAAGFAWRDSLVLTALNGLGLLITLTPMALRGRTRGLTYAGYARRGFFELVTVAMLVLPRLLLGRWLLPKKLRAEERIFGLLAGSMVAMLFVIMASAVQRMLLYQSIYGLTELRLYTTAFMGWLALVFLWFLATVLRGQRERFACGALVAGLGVIAALVAMNPDALIVRTNVAHVRAGRALDDGYLAALSADAVPALVRALPELDDARRPAVTLALLRRWSQPGGHDWRTWNRARELARSAVRGLDGTAEERRGTQIEAASNRPCKRSPSRQSG
jgi:hypothetical protein